MNGGGGGVAYGLSPRRLLVESILWTFVLVVDVSKLQVHNIVSSNKVISKVSFPRGLDKTNTKIIVNLQLFGQSINLRNLIKLTLTLSLS